LSKQVNESMAKREAQVLECQEIIDSEVASIIEHTNKSKEYRSK